MSKEVTVVVVDGNQLLRQINRIQKYEKNPYSCTCSKYKEILRDLSKLIDNPPLMDLPKSTSPYKKYGEELYRLAKNTKYHINDSKYSKFKEFRDASWGLQNILNSLREWEEEEELAKDE